MEHANGTLKNLLRAGGANITGELAVKYAEVLHPLDLILRNVDANISRHARTSSHTGADASKDIARVAQCLLTAGCFLTRPGRVHEHFLRATSNPFTSRDVHALRRYVEEKQLELHNGQLMRGYAYVHRRPHPHTAVRCGTCVCSCVPAALPADDDTEPWQRVQLQELPVAVMAFRNKLTGESTTAAPTEPQCTRDKCRPPCAFVEHDRVEVRVAGAWAPGRVHAAYFKSQAWWYVIMLDTGKEIRTGEQHVRR